MTDMQENEKVEESASVEEAPSTGDVENSLPSEVEQADAGADSVASDSEAGQSEEVSADSSGTSLFGDAPKAGLGDEPVAEAPVTEGSPFAGIAAKLSDDAAENSEVAEESSSSEEAQEAPAVKEESAAAAASESSGEESSEEEEDERSMHGFQELDEERAALPWYVVNTYSGYEMNAKKNLEERIRARNIDRMFGNVLIPQETVVELVRGQKKTSTRKFFPGYILVQMDLNDETWHLVKDTPKVTGFIGDPRNPSPLSPDEVANLLQQMEGGASRPRPRVQFEEGDAIKVIDGPFTDFNGTVDEVKPDKGKLRVLISIFGRNTPVELDFVQVEKA